MRRAVSIFLVFLLGGALTFGLNGVTSAESSVYVFAVWYRVDSSLRVGLFYIVVESNSSVSEFAYNQSVREVGFKVAGPNDTLGFCNVMIPKTLLNSPWTVLANGTDIPYLLGENDTYSWLYFTYPHSLHEIQIVGSYTWTYELINPDKAVAAGEKVYFMSRINYSPNSTLPMLIYGGGRLVSTRNADWCRSSAMLREYPPFLPYTIPVGASVEGATAVFVIKENLEYWDGYGVHGELHVDVHYGTPLSLSGRFNIVFTNPLIANVSLFPDTLNVTGDQEWVAAYIELPDGYNLTDVDISTIQLNIQLGKTVLADPSFSPEIGDFDNDSISEMLVRFDTESLVSLIHSIPDLEYSNLSLKLTGRLANETFIDGKWIDEIPFEADCSLRVIPMPGDVNCDGKVNIYDVVQASGAYGSTPLDPNWDPHCDITEPYGEIDIYDVIIICNNYGEEYTP